MRRPRGALEQRRRTRPSRRRHRRIPIPTHQPIATCMDANSPNQAPEAAHVAGDAPATAIRIILADSQAIYRVGTKKIFALEDDVRVVAQAENLGQVQAAIQKYPCDVILFESAVSSNPPEAVSEIMRKKAD